METVPGDLNPTVSFVDPDPVDSADAVVIVFHGGKVRSKSQPSRRQLAVLRMRPFERELVKAGRRQGLAVGSVLFRYRGWNGAEASPVADVEKAIALAKARYGDIPIVLVGHSMGGRAALLGARDPAVTGVVALAPWLEPGDKVPSFAGKALRVIHGSRDRWTDPRASRALVEAVNGVASSTLYVEMKGERHSMLRRATEWHALTTELVLSILGKQSEDARRSNVLQSTQPGTVHLML